MPNWKKVIVSGSNASLNSLIVDNGITGSLFGTASFAISASQAQNSVSSSYALTASNVLGGNSNFIALWDTTSSLSSSFIYQSGTNIGINVTSSFRGNLDVRGAWTDTYTSGNGQLAVIGNISASNASGSGNGGVIVLGGSTSDADLTRTFVSLGGFKENNTNNNRAGYFSLGVRSGISPADIIERIRVSSTGLTSLTGSLIVSESVTANQGFTGSLFGTASHAVTSSYITASNVFGPYGSNSVISASFAQTSSYAINMVVSGSINNVDYIDFNNTLSPLPATVEGRIFWDEDNGTLSLGMHGGQVLQQIGLEEYFYVKNQTGVTLTNGAVIRSAGTLGNSGRILGDYMIADGTIPYYYTLGIATEDIINGEDGYVTQFGAVRGIDTTGTSVGETWNDGDILWVSTTVLGGLTKFEPDAPNLKIQMAIVIKADANGILFVRPELNSFLTDLHNVNDFSTTSSYGDLLIKSGSTWINSKQLTGSYGLTGSLTVINGGITGSLRGTSSFATQAITSSYADSFIVNNNAVISGSLTILQNLTVFGSASITYVSESTLNIGTNLITVNSNTPAVRFGGIAVIDSGSSPQVSGSWLFDSTQNRWIFLHQQTVGSALTSSIGIMGPETYNNQGNETQITQNRIIKGYSGASGEHVGDSQISDNGTTVSIPGILVVTGSITGSLFGTASWATNALTASSADNFTVRGNTSITGSVIISQSLAIGTPGVNVSPGRVFSVFASASNTITSNTANARFISDGQFFSSGPYIGTYYSSPYASYIQVARPSDGAVYPLVLNPLGANVGVGTSDPQAGLDVNGSGRYTNGLIVTGSLTVISGAIEFQVTDTGVKIGNAIGDIHTVTGSLRISGSTTINGNGSFSGSVTITGSLGVGTTGSAVVGRIDASNDVVAFATSDINLKENLKPIANALYKLDNIQGYTFDWKQDEKLVSQHGFTGRDIGVIAQEIEEILPEVVTTRDSGYKAVKYEKIVPFLIQCIKELKDEIEELKGTKTPKKTRKPKAKSKPE